MLEFLVCPVTRGPLSTTPTGSELVSRNAGLAFPIQDGIPVMLADEAPAGSRTDGRSRIAPAWPRPSLSPDR